MDAMACLGWRMLRADEGVERNPGRDAEPLCMIPLRILNISTFLLVNA